ncbi:MAG: hypothetical protein J6X38_03935 [Abditibacteriota bacterium]|nr:hypothetical protein [Abditibacteriota bacterium]
MKVKSFFTALLIILAVAANADTTVKGVYNVADFGAKPDGITDCTKAFQNALNACDRAGGGVVKIPVGDFLFKGHLDVPRNVTIEGVASAPARFDDHRSSRLLAVENKGKEDGEPFLYMRECSAIKGLTIFYPEQSPDPEKVVAYPWTVRGDGDNINIEDVLMINPYKAVDFGTMPCGRHLVRNLFGSALKTGIFIDKCYDVGRLENIHFWPFWTEKMMKRTEKDATAFIFGRTDWEYVTGCFSIFYHVGIEFGDFGSGPGNVVMTNSGSDICDTAVLVNNVQGHAGAAFTNCQFMGTVKVSPTNDGPVKFVNCGFWGTGEYKTASAALLRGKGNTVFSACHFTNWDFAEIKAYAIDIDGGGLTVTGCDFMDKDKNYIKVGKNTDSAIITSNRFRGGEKVSVADGVEVQKGFNTNK